MPRLASIAMFSLIVALAATVAAIAVRTTAVGSPTFAPQAADPAIGYAFYRALDTLVASGDPSALLDVVAPGFIDHAPGGGDATVDALSKQLTELAESFPDARFPVRAIARAPGILVVSLAPVGPMTGLVAGLPARADPIDGLHEVLRVRNGRVIERWPAPFPDLHLQTFAASVPAVSAATSLVVKLERIELPERGSIEAFVRHPMVVLVESGSLEVVSRSQDSHSPARVRLEPGLARTLDADASVAVRAADDAGATLLLFSRAQVVPGETSLPDFSAGTKSTLLWSSYLPMHSGGQWRVAFGTLTMPAETAVTLENPDAAQLLLAAERGSATLSLESGSISMLDTVLYPSNQGIEATLGADRAARIEDAGTLRVADAGSDPVTVWIVSFTLDTPESTPVAR